MPEKEACEARYVSGKQGRRTLNNIIQRYISTVIDRVYKLYLH